MVPLSFDLLVGLMAFSGHQDDVARSCKRTGGFDSFQPVYNDQHFAFICNFNSRLHIGQDGFGLLKAGIVAGEDDTITQCAGNSGHDRPFGRIAVASGSCYRYQLFVMLPDAVDGFEDIFQRIRRMSVIHNGGNSIGRPDIVESSGYRFHAAQQGQKCR